MSRHRHRPEHVLEPTILALSLALLVAPALSRPAHAETIPDFRIFAAVQPLPPGEVGTLVVTGYGSCGELLPIEIDGDHLRLPVVTICPLIPPDPIPFRLETSVGPLDEGVYTVDLVTDFDGTVLATTQLVVAQPTLDLGVVPPEPTTRDRVTFMIAGTAECPQIRQVEIGAGRIDIELGLGCPFTPPPPPHPFVLASQLGRLSSGDHEVVVHDASEVLGSSLVTVLDVPPVMTFEPPEPTEAEGFTAIAALPFVLACDPVREVTVGGFVATVRLDDACLLVPPGQPAPTFSTVEASFPALPAGTYRVRFLDGQDRVLAQAPVTVRSASGACIPTETTLCLQGDRFRVRAMWETSNGVIGPAHTQPRTADSGAFSFFDPDNVELVVKVLDACNTSFHSYWVFTAGLTNVAVNLEVTDTLNEVTWTASNPQGHDFTPILDTRAFATCP
ncbi:MAG: hypothetical protein KDD11_08970 [Acidobacteria bacterium]|nr:hypothetical protein [Acidobacteriota bacterium]